MPGATAAASILAIGTFWETPENPDIARRLRRQTKIITRLILGEKALPTFILSNWVIPSSGETQPAAGGDGGLGAGFAGPLNISG